MFTNFYIHEYLYCLQENIFFDIAELNWKMNRTRMGKEKEKEGTIRKDITGR